MTSLQATFLLHSGYGACVGRSWSTTIGRMTTPLENTPIGLRSTDVGDEESSDFDKPLDYLRSRGAERFLDNIPEPDVMEFAHQGILIKTPCLRKCSSVVSGTHITRCMHTCDNRANCFMRSNSMLRIKTDERRSHPRSFLSGPSCIPLTESIQWIFKRLTRVTEFDLRLR